MPNFGAKGDILGRIEDKLIDLYENSVNFLNAILSVINPRNSINVEIQDQYTEIIDLHVSYGFSDLILTTNYNKGDRVINANVPSHTPIAGDSVCLKEGVAFYQADIISVVSNGANNYDLGLDMPLDYDYTVLGGCSVRTKNLADSRLPAPTPTNPVIFSLSPEKLTIGTKWDLTRIIGSFTGVGTGSPLTGADDTTFGTQAPLTNGIFFRTVNHKWKNLFNVKSNSDLRAHAYDLSFQDANRASLYGVSWRRSFAGSDKNGVTIRLESKETDSDEFHVVIQDPLTAHNEINFVVQGHVVED